MAKNKDKKKIPFNVFRKGLTAGALGLAMLVGGAGMLTACGEKGDRGETGASGKSAYEIAVEQGFTGTVNEWLESLKGQSGGSGSAGNDGVGIQSITKTGTDGLVDTYTITFTNGTTTTFTITNGQNGTTPNAPEVTISEDGYWEINGVKQSVKAEASNGAPGKTPYIEGEYWYIDGESTGVKAQGVAGNDGKSAYDLYMQENPEFTGGVSGWLETLKGQDGKDGSMWFTGTMVTGTGSSIAKEVTGSKVGDLYLNTDTSDVYECVATNTWKWIANIKGSQGDPGSNGNNGSNGTIWFSGISVPSDSIGNVGDFYYDTDSYDIYIKSNDGWDLISNIKGEDGERGPAGVGEGNPGNTWTIGESDPTEVANIGDMYLNKTTYDIYQYTAEGWDLIGSIAGVTKDTVLQAPNGQNIFIELASKNLYNENDEDFMPGYRAGSTTGNPSQNADTNLSGFMYVGDTEYVVMAADYQSVGRRNITTMTRIYGYDENKQFVAESYAFNGTAPYYTVPEGVVYIRAAVATIYHNVQIEKGQQATEYSPFALQYEIDNTFIPLPDRLSEFINDANYIKYDNTRCALPKTIYGFAGQTIKIYFENIMPYPLGSVNIRVTSNAKGKIYSDRWEYTPSAAETFTLKITVYSLNYDLLQENVFNVNIKDSTTKNDVKVLVIGDSTVNAGVETGKMLDLAGADDNYNITFLGTRGEGENQHEGRGGWTADMFINKASNTSGSVTNPFYNPQTSKFDMSYYMESMGYESVDYVFIQLGINDMFAAKSDSELATALDTYMTNIDYMVESIKAYNSNIKVIINLIIPCEPDQDKFAESYGVTQTSWCSKRNTYFANLQLLDKYSYTSGVVLSWYNAAIDIRNNMDGGVHPVKEGYQQLGEQMYYLLKAIS